MSTYYIIRQKALLAGHAKLLGGGANLLHAQFGPEASTQIFREAAVEFERLIPEIPYIGGNKNSLTDTLVQMTSLLALYRVLKARGQRVEDIGALVQAMGQQWVERQPRWLRRAVGKLLISHFWRDRQRRAGQVTQQREYPDNFVFEVIEGDGQNFDWGINYLECGVLKFFHQQNADELTPYMCEIDYLLFPGAGVGFHRTGTLAHGCAQCDFRFKRL